MKELLILLRKGSKSARIAAIVNTIIALIKGTAFFVTGNVAMFAETMHSLGDAANQFFVYIGSALSKKSPTKRFPNGFGRLVHLVLLGAVLIVGIMAFETIKEGWSHVLHPTPSKGVLINLAVLFVGVLLESFVLYKAMKEVLHDANVPTNGIGVIVKSFGALSRAKPATKLVFMEDLVATGGGILAIIAIVVSKATSFHQAEGLASIIIGLMMLYVVGKVFLENAAGALGEADSIMEERISQLLMKDPDVKDIVSVTVIKEGEALHAELEVEIDPTLTVAEADDIKDRLSERITKEHGVLDITIQFDEDDGVANWKNPS
ncbi:Cation diffusion facilitator family transporter [Fictibacillus macauensis ZFHKF-1]|uniref:Cation diffusion facilitator family transporter n=1 Tax=Fictibacillus macauensis ZFHKF-1 TaxID=1196324 RepID=I8AIT3_9BACL|nr:cation diffusion facilitator family transporter [Fictibacillus macauensis]EIT85662.1 Cation diffusion facilitator family transporter [Fictibacillus macauensis ZFHKF-1]